MANRLLPSPTEAAEPAPASATGTAESAGHLLVVGSSDAVIMDWIDFARRENKRSIAVLAPERLCRQVDASVECQTLEEFSRAALLKRCQGPAALVLFLGPRLDRSNRGLIDSAAAWADALAAERIILVSTLRVHFGDRAAAEIESYAQARFRRPGAKVIVFRPAPILSEHSNDRWALIFFSAYRSAVPRRRSGCCVDGSELFAAIATELGRTDSRDGAIYYLLGPNRPWRDWLDDLYPLNPLRRWFTKAAVIGTLLHRASLRFLHRDIAPGWLPCHHWWSFDTLYPDSQHELLALYNRYNFRHVKVVGYNNGVVHFGQKYPGRTVVSTVRCARVARLHGNRAVFDAGVTLRRAVDVLNGGGKQFHVLPNYSYVSTGTAFFVPVHGSASDGSMMADAIERVLLYDPAADRFISARRGDAAFGEFLYNATSDVLLLRLRFRVQDASKLRLEKKRVENPTSQDVLALLRDPGAANVEIRKPRAAGPAIDVYRYYTGTAGGAEALDLPRDSIGRLWDRLEENRLTSYLFHALTRNFAYHVELFLTAEEFPLFWETHAALPLAKIQLRYLRRDGFPHSPCAEHDCIAVDLFMRKRHRDAFNAYIKENFRAVQFNPGKHSM